MSLKQSIIVRNEFSTKSDGGKGTRGSSPSAYIDYMTRDPATEGVTPIKLKNVDNLLTRYNIKESMLETSDDVFELKHRIKSSDKRAGVAFCNNNVSMSNEELLKKKKEMDDAFHNQNKTWLKTVISFSPEYLEEMGIVEKGFVCNKRGDYRGHVDQMKLRLAIMHGLDKMAKGRYDDLQYVGTIQVDTRHVHCHLSMMDMGEGQIMPDGKQRGKLDDTCKKRIRRGVDDYLDETHMVRQMSSNVQHDKHNTVCFIKRFAHQTIDERGLSQFLLACLPDDRRLWRANTNNESMKKPNYIVRGYVNELLSKPNSGYHEALSAIDKYVHRRQDREGLSDEEARELYLNGQKSLIDDCVNGVYSVLKRVPKDEQNIRTPMMVAMAQSYEDMAANVESDPMIEFGFRLRSYSTRLDHHRKEKNKYSDFVKRAELQHIDETAKPFVDFLKFERDYNDMLMSKYQHFLAFLPGDETFNEEFESLVKDKRRLIRFNSMLSDKSIIRMTPDNAEKYGRSVYDLRGGRYIRYNRELLETRRDELQHSWNERVDDFRERLSDKCMQLEFNDDGSMKVKKGSKYDFELVKALDIHHLGYDFPIDVHVSRVNVERFVSVANKRYELMQGARNYLINSGQSHGVGLLPVRDVENMKMLADKIQVNPVIIKQPLLSSSSRKSGRTFRLDNDVKKDMDFAVRLAVDTQIELMS